MKIKTFHIDAFTESHFKGNPAAVCVLKKAINPELMQKIAYENNLSETAFIIPQKDDYLIRWFTPTVEIDLCGHATLASAHVVFTETNFTKNTVAFISQKHGELKVTKSDKGYTLIFPKDPPIKIEMLKIMEKQMGPHIQEMYRSSTDFIAVLNSEEEVHNFIPDMKLIRELESNGLVITARGNDVDFVSRYFAPQIGIDEDPVTGAIHTALIPLWAKKTGNTIFKAKQLSRRSGELFCELSVKDVKITGQAVTFAKGQITV